MGYTHFDKLSAENGYAVGAYGSETAIIDSSGNVDGVDVSAITAMKNSVLIGASGTGTLVIDQFQVTSARTLTRIDAYFKTAFAQSTDADETASIDIYDATAGSTVVSVSLTSGSNTASATGSYALVAGHNYQVRVSYDEGAGTVAGTQPADGNITLHLEQA